MTSWYSDYSSVTSGEDGAVSGLDPDGVSTFVDSLDVVVSLCSTGVT